MQENMQQNSRPVTHLFVALSFRQFRKVDGGKQSISYCQSTSYHSYMSHNNKAFCRPSPCGTFNQFYCSKNVAIQSNTRKIYPVPMESASLTFVQAQRQLHAKYAEIARLLFAIAICIAFVDLKFNLTIIMIIAFYRAYSTPAIAYW